ncbi:MAG: class II fructose-bisphosphatase [Dehalococcoidia bacterium]|nr:class II fructose-bisphosphatase [Chloroflexi bacterium CFX7]MCL4231690.1 class II fructose-bisphosphatase [Dehalococcoidia bacterium]NUQ55124.1 class II fructose-bisphosphatase [Dehalococcoidia bacterium]RIL03220.1 MAG: class II fructose-bisphosphatase [bacterium]
MRNEQVPDRNIAMELVRTTEAAALAAARWMGRGNKNSADGAAVDAMRMMLDTVDMDGIIVIGEGEKDEAPMLYNGERVGNGRGPQVDVAVDPIDGTRLLSLGRPNALSVVAVAPRGTMFNPRDIFYMDKIAVGPEARGMIDISAPVGWNIEQVARAKGIAVNEVTVVVLDRDRNTEIVDAIRETQARIRFITDGDVAGAIMAAMAGTGVDMLLGIGGSPEGVVSACAIKSLEGDMQGRLWPRHDDDRRLASERGIDLDRVLALDDLVSSDDVFFAASGITTGDLLKGVDYVSGGATSESLVMRGRTGTIRRIQTEHHWRKLERISGGRYN